MLAKVYLEITNVCNLHCAFCPGTRRAPRFMTAAEFRTLAEKLVGQTRYLYLHVMGEPLLHPALEEILTVGGQLGFRLCITTNGTLLPQKGELLLSHARDIHKISISLHSFEANEGQKGEEDYYNACLRFQKEAASRGILSVLRLWNLDGRQKGLNGKNEAILTQLETVYPRPWEPVQNGFRLAEHSYLEWGERFDWPGPGEPDYGEKRFCRGLKDQVGVLCDGQVVPCCLDGEGRIPLGNLFEQTLEEILSTDRAKRIRQGFTQNKAVEDLCRRCGYSTRFNR